MIDTHSRDTRDFRAGTNPVGGRIALLGALVLAALVLSGCESTGSAFSFFGVGDATASTEPASKAEIKEIQGTLAKKGYSPGPADGMIGPRTTGAIRQYQRDAKLRVNGQATKGLLAHLKKSDVTYASGARRGSGTAAAIETSRLDSFAVLPNYEPGDAFVYSDGIVRLVLRVGAERVSWRESTGDTYMAMRSVGLPLLEWESGAWRGRTNIEQGAIADWPPAEGQEAAFDVQSEEWNGTEGEDAPRLATEERWTCRNEGHRKITVPAGRFETVIIACERSPAPAGTWQKRIWYYSPDVRHPLRREDLDSAGRKLDTIELVAAMPGGKDWPPVARAGLQWAVRDALTNNAVGEESEWRSTAVSERFMIRITDEKQDDAGTVCRSYVLVRTGAELRRIYPALACRKADGEEWRTPGAAEGFMEFSAAVDNLG